jgi:antitoxin VapB
LWYFRRQVQSTEALMGVERQIRLESDGDGQMIHIPSDFVLPGEEAVISKLGESILIRPVQKRTSGLLEWLAQQEPWPDDEAFPEMDLRDPPPDDVNI